MSRQLRLFDRLVRIVYPEEFRADYQSEMTRTFRAQHRDADGGGVVSILRLWSETLAGFVRTAPREHAAQLKQDVQYAVRMMRRAPTFTAVAVMTLATAIGANTAIFSVVDAVLLRPLPYANSESVSLLWNHWKGSDKAHVSNPEFLDARERLRSVDVAAFSKVVVNLTGRGEPERLLGTDVTANYLEVLGVNPVLGRSFLPQEERQGEGQVVILTHDLWARLFNSSRDALGQSLVLNGEPYTIVGVLPPTYVTPDEFGSLQRSELLVPLTFDPAAVRNERGSHYLALPVRLRTGYSATQAQAEIDALTHAFQTENPGEYDADYGATLFPLRTEVVGEVRRPLLIMVGAVALVLLIACANVANLLLARGQVRAREIAVRKALGASQPRLVRQVITESLVLAALAAAAGILLARSILALIVGSATNIPRVADVNLDPMVLLFTGGIAVVTALIFGSLPALQLANKDVAPELHSGRSGRTSLRQGIRAMLVTAQVALALVLLVGAGLLIQSFTRLLGVPSGFNPEHVLTLRVSVPTAGYEERDRVVRFFDQMLDGVRASQGVVSAGAVAGLPLQAQRGDWDFYMEGETPGAHGSDRPGDWQVVTPGYFETMGIRLVRGRFIDASDRTESPAVALINETLARQFFSGRDPVGRQIRMSGNDRPWMTIVGVVGDVRQDGLDTSAVPEIYMPHAQFRPFWRDTTLRTFTIVVRAAGDPGAMTAAVRQQVRQLDSNLPISTVITMEEVVSRSVAERRLHMLLLGFFAAVALVLAIVGTYGVLAYQITERTREFGVRMALGARAGDILRMVLRPGMAPALAGVGIGLAGAALMTRLLATLLFNTQPLDPATFAGTAIALLAAALLACCVPARRATRVAPSTALRAE
jgi:putative ABC transport system permease protein